MYRVSWIASGYTIHDACHSLHGPRYTFHLPCVVHTFVNLSSSCTVQKETLEEVNKHLELEAMTKDQELTKRADKGTT